MNKIENAVIKYQIDFEKYKNGQANAIIKLLDNADSEIAKYIKMTTDISTKKRYNQIAKKLKEISSALKYNIEGGIDIDGVINYELKKQSKILDTLKSNIIKVQGVGEVNFLYPSVEQIKTSALFNPITKDNYGMTWQSFLNGIESGFYNTWDVGVRTGYLTGIPTKEIVNKVLGGVSKIDKLTNPGSITSLRNSVYANTRTALQSLANETQRRIYEENDKYFGDKGYKYEYLATLDSRACLVCAEASSRLYKELKDVPHIPQHRGCRCYVIPYFDIEGDTKSSKDGYVDSKLSFNDWLKEQDEKTQLDVLGRTRYELFKRGEPITQFVDNGKTLTLDELKNKIDIKSILSQNIKEPNINNLSLHLKERMEERGITLEEINDTVSNPLVTKPLRDDGTYQVIGEKVTIGVSSYDGTITTVWKTSERRAKKLLQEKNK